MILISQLFQVLGRINGKANKDEKTMIELMKISENYFFN